MITLIGDLHVKKSNLEKQKQLFKDIEELDNEDIILTGDLLDTKSVVKSECLNFLYEEFRTSSKHFWIIIGNHDQHHLGATEHSLEPLKALDNVTIIDELGEFTIGRLQLVGIPYIHDPEDFKTVVEHVENKKDKILICHQGFTGFDYGSGYIAKEETEVNSVKGFKAVYAGHFHKYQKFDNGCYIGTPFSHNFGESNQVKYIGEIDEKGTLALQETDFPKHLTYEIDCGDELEHKIENYSSSNYNRIILRGSSEDISTFDKSLYEDSKILEVPEMKEEGKKVEISEALSNSKKFEFWAKEVGQMKADTIQLGIEILNNLR